MKERPILFSAPMVRAILDSRKTQTRRIINPQPYIDGMGNFCWNGENFGQDFNGPCIQAIASPIPSSKTKRVRCPYGKPGDRLWVRETFKQHDEVISYKADGTWITDFQHTGGINPHENITWIPSIHMPRNASRILLEITGVRVERLQDISEEDAIAEGCIKFPFEDDHAYTFYDDDKTGHATHTGAYRKLWESLNGTGSWDLNPWVWVVEFRTLEIARAAT